MKSIKIFIGAVIALATLLAGCKKDEVAPTPAELFMSRLAGTWKLTTAVLDDAEVTKYFPGLEISFSLEKTFTVKNAVAPVWPSVGTFELQPRQEHFDILRIDGVLVAVSDLADKSVRLNFNYSPANGRTESVSGEYEFVLRKE